MLVVVIVVAVVHHGRDMRRIPLLQIVHAVRIAVAVTVARQVHKQRIRIARTIHASSMIVTHVPSNGSSDLRRRSLPRTSTASRFGRRKRTRLRRVSLKGKIAAVVALDVVAVAGATTSRRAVVSCTSSQTIAGATSVCSAPRSSG